MHQRLVPTSHNCNSDSKDYVRSQSYSFFLGMSQSSFWKKVISGDLVIIIPVTKYIRLNNLIQNLITVVHCHHVWNIISI